MGPQKLAVLSGQGQIPWLKGGNAKVDHIRTSRTTH